MLKLLSVAAVTAALVTVSCRSPSAPQLRDEVGVIVFYGDSSDVLAMPASARAGFDLAVTVRTFGDGCTTAAGTAVTYRGNLAIVTPFDNQQSRVPAIYVCTALLVRPVHTVALRFPTPGMARVRVEGRREPGSTFTAIEGTLAITD